MDMFMYKERQKYQKVWLEVNFIKLIFNLTFNCFHYFPPTPPFQDFIFQKNFGMQV